jgi:alkylhydroperoxidase family enzyme
VSAVQKPSLLRLGEAQRAAASVGIAPNLASLNVFRLLLHRPKAARALADLLFELLAGRALDHRLRELVILRVGWVTGSDYEWSQHSEIAQQFFAFTSEDLVAVRDWEAARQFTEPERVALAAVDETLAAGAISQETVSRCVDRIGDQATIELVLTIGTWRTISEVTRSFRIMLEEGKASWPPDGVSPR